MITAAPEATCLPLEQAQQIEKWVKRRFDIAPCRWCSADPSGFMMPRTFMHSAFTLYCSICGKWSGTTLDSRLVTDFWQAVLSEKNPLHEAMMALIKPESYPEESLEQFVTADFAKLAQAVCRSDSAHITTWINSYTGLPQSTSIKMRPYREDAYELYIPEWSIIMVLAAATNQAVMSRTETLPVFNFDSQTLCPHCEADASHHQMRNYDMMWGDADIVCTACGGHVRTWSRD